MKYENKYRLNPSNKDLTKMQDQLEFLLMRENFISPSLLPVIAESFLRSDFNYSEYLGRSLSKVFSMVFSFTISSLLMCLLIVYIVIGISAFKEEIKVNVFFPLVFYFLPLFLVGYCFLCADFAFGFDFLA